MNKDLRTLTLGEELFLARKAAGRTQAEEARRRGLGRNAYAEAEADGNRPPTPVKKARGPVSVADLLRIARRRSGLGLAGVAKRVKATRVSVLARERRGDPILVLFWELRGFRFPGS